MVAERAITSEADDESFKTHIFFNRDFPRGVCSHFGDGSTKRQGLSRRWITDKLKETSQLDKMLRFRAPLRELT